MAIPSLPHPEHHWVIPHHLKKLDATTTLKVINIFEQHEGKIISSNSRPDRVEINRTLGQLLSEDERNGVPDPFRDYQQLYTHFGILYPHTIAGGQLRLTPIAKQLAEERIGLAEFLFLQAFGYQVPSGASEPKQIRIFLNRNILVKPILMIYQVLVSLQKQGERQGYISQDEITTFIEPQIDHSNIEETVSSILEIRRPQFGKKISLPYRYPKDTRNTFNERKRVVEEFVRFLEFLPFFEVSLDETEKKKIRLNIPENERIGLPEVQILAEVEEKIENFYQFSDGEKPDRLKWYEYYCGLERRIRWYQQAQKLAILPLHPPELKLRPFSKSQQRSVITITPLVVQRTPEQTATLQQQRLDAHEQIIDKLATYILAAKGTTSYDPHSVDLDAQIEETRYFFEVKSLAEDQSDAVEQVREAVGQLLEYQYRAGESIPSHLCVVFDRFPDAEKWIIAYLINHLHMLVCWWNNNIMQFEVPNECKAQLTFLLNDQIVF